MATKTNKRYNFGQPLEIHWVDSYELYGWGYADDLQKEGEMSYCVTKACYLSEDNQFIYLAHTIGRDKNKVVLGRLAIPKITISNISELFEGKPKNGKKKDTKKGNI